MPQIYFSYDHEWIAVDDDGVATIGITDHAQQALGDIVFVELPDSGREVAVGEACAVVESVKAASDVYAPLAGVVVGYNDAIISQPALLNREPMTGAWLFKLRLADVDAVKRLMDMAAYEAFVGTLA